MRARKPAKAMVLAFQQEREECARHQADIDALREDIAALDASIEQERASLSAFEQRYCIALEREHALLARIDGFLRHLQSLGRLLTDQAIGPKERRQHLRMLHRLRARELSAWHERRLAAKQARDKETEKAPSTEATHHALALSAFRDVTEQQERMRTVYRQLARRFHPDLARDEQAREAHSRLMAHVNALYAQEDFERLVALGERANAEGLDALLRTDDAVDWVDALRSMREQLVWTRAICDSLHEERRDLERCAVAELQRAVQTQRVGRRGDPFDALKADAKRRATEQIKHLPAAIFSLEQRVKRARTQQRSAVLQTALAERSSPSVATAFDPHVGHVLCKLSLAAMERQRLSPRIQRMAGTVIDLAATEPALLRLVLFAYIAELTPQPLDALATYDAMAMRFDALAHHDDKHASLPETLVQGDGLVQYRVDKAHTSAPRLTLGLRDRTLVQAVAGALEEPRVRDAFANVLLHLGEAASCAQCRRTSFEVPLFYLRGLDDLRANVCAHCGHAIRRYVLARGEDVQAILNQAYLDTGLLQEWSIGIGRRQVGLQYLSRQMAQICTRDVLERICTDLFVRNGLRIRPREVLLLNHDEPIAPTTVLGELFEPSLRLVGRGAQMGRERQWCEELSYRVKVRFRAHF